MQIAGLVRGRASRSVRLREVRKFFPDGLSTEGHHIMHIMDSEKAVGTIWYWNS